MTTQEQATDITAAEGATQKTTSAATAPQVSKAKAVEKLLKRSRGATVVELMDVTSWKNHSVRAFLSGLRKKGRTVTKEPRKSGEVSYRLGAAPAVAAGSDDK